VVDPRPVRRRATSGWLAGGTAAGVLLAVGAVWLAVTLLGSEAEPTASGPPMFVDDAVAAGVEHVYDGEFTFFVGGGVAVLDCNDDGLPDLFLAGGENPASLYRNESPIGGALQFVELADSVTDLTAVVGAYPIDIDGDRHVDLAVLRLGENVLLRGLGECRFERANERWAFDGGEAWSGAFSATWEDDGLPTLAVGNYLALDEAGEYTFDCADNELFRPDPAGYSAVAALSPGWCTLSVLFSDWDRSGHADLRVTNDRHYYRDGEEQLWRIERGAAPELYAEADGWKSMQIWGMGIASYDVTGDGLPEVFLTSQGDNKLQTLAEDAEGPSYVDIAIRRGVTAHRPYVGDQVRPSTAWHPEFQDVNNDGFIDLYISKGNVDAMVEYAADDPSNLLLGQPDGTFLEGAVDAGIVNFSRSRGAALVDFNLDGLLDLVEVNRREPVTLWRNVGSGDADDPDPMGNWIAIQLGQPGTNVDGIGSWIEVKVGDRTVEREVIIGGGHAGGQLGWIHFGLGNAGGAEVRVHWPGGDIGQWLDIDANTFAIIDRAKPSIEVWDPASGS